MIRFLLNTAIQLVVSALALLVAAWVIPGVGLELAGFLVAVVILTVAQAILTPFVFNLARKYASAVLGGVGLVAAFLALWVASLFPGGLHLSGWQAWVLSPLLVWVITALGTWIFGYFVIKRWWGRKQEAKKAARARAS